MSSKNFSQADLNTLETLVRLAAKEELLSTFGNADYAFKEDGSVVTTADLAMQKRLEKDLAEQWPDYALLGEEMTELEQETVFNHEAGYWCVDPVDGTSNFTAGLPFFAVSIALIVQQKQKVGLIYDPVRDEMFTAIKDKGAKLNGEALRRKEHPLGKARHIVSEVDLKRLPKKLQVRLIEESFISSQRNLGSSAIDWCWLAAGRFDIYLHGGQKLWDYAAGSLIFEEAGGRSVSLDAGPVFRGRLETRSILASFDDELFQRWHDWIKIPLY